MDPQQRLLLEATEEALSAARLSVLGAVTGEPACPKVLSTMRGMSWQHALQEPRCLLRSHPPVRVTRACLPFPPAAVGEGVGVFVGISTPDYSTVAQSATDISPYSATGAALSVAPGRISYAYGFKGPSVAIDTGGDGC